MKKIIVMLLAMGSSIYCFAEKLPDLKSSAHSCVELQSMVKADGKAEVNDGLLGALEVQSNSKADLGYMTKKAYFPSNDKLFCFVGYTEEEDNEGNGG